MRLGLWLCSWMKMMHVEYLESYRYILWNLSCSSFKKLMAVDDDTFYQYQILYIAFDQEYCRRDHFLVKGEIFRETWDLNLKPVTCLWDHLVKIVKCRFIELLATIYDFGLMFSKKTMCRDPRRCLILHRWMDYRNEGND